MRWFTSLSLLLVVIFSIMMSVSIFVGNAQPLPERVQRLHLADCSLPCWNGIMPGVSTPSEVQTRINTSLPDFEGAQAVKNDKFLTWATFDNFNRIVSVIDVTFDNGLVSTIGIGTDHLSQDMPSLGEVLTVFGSPTCVTIDDTTDFSVFYYENSAQHFILQFSVLPSTLSSSVDDFVFGVPDNATCAMSWHDFRNSQRSLFESY